MSCATHTPGPWRIDGESDNEGEAETIVAGDGSRTIAWTCNTFDSDADDGYGEEIITDEDRANGYLIASAPDMLEALQEARDELIRLYEKFYPNDESDNETTEIIDYVIATIEQARGN